MGWRDLFRSNTPSPDLRIHWFGKLPDYADYYRSPSEQDWTVEFIDWILKGYQIYKGRLGGEGSDNPVLPSCGLLLRLPKTEMTVFASIRDYGGDMRGRSFPFCVFAGGPTSDFPGPSSNDAGLYLRVIEDLHALHSDVKTHLKTAQRLDALLGGRTRAVNSRAEGDEGLAWTEEAKSVALADWLDGLGSDSMAPDRQTWLKRAAAWGNNLAELDGKRVDATLRVPLSVGVDASLQISGWLLWLENRLDWSRRPLSLVVGADVANGAASLIVMAKGLEGEDFLLATPLAPTLACLDDLVAAKPVGGLTNLHPALELSTASWLDFAEQPRTLT